MTDPNGDPTTSPLRSTATRVAPVSATVAPPGVLLVAPVLDGPGAVVTLGLVLAEAIALYVGYGVLTRIVGSTLRELLGST